MHKNLGDEKNLIYCVICKTPSKQLLSFDVVIVQLLQEKKRNCKGTENVRESKNTTLITGNTGRSYITLAKIHCLDLATVPGEKQK
jgi:hypothetical protein